MRVISLAQALAILRRGRRDILLAVAGTVMVAVLFVFLQPTVYSATAELSVVATIPREAVPFWQAIEDEEPSPPEIAQDIRSRRVTQRVLEHFETELPPQLFEEKVSVEAVSNTDLFQVTVTDSEASRAVAIADRYAEEYLAAATSQDQSFAPGVVFEGERVTPAVTPDAPVSPRPVRTTTLAVIVGLAVGVVAAFVRDHLDAVVRTDEQVRELLGPGLPALGRIPHHTGHDIAVPSTDSQHAETYENLAANIRHLLVRGDTTDASTGSGPTPPARGRSVVVSSAQAGDGRTTIATNLAVAAARAGREVILVDANLHRAGVMDAFGLSADLGLDDVVTNGTTVSGALVATEENRLRILPAGSPTNGATRVLASSRMDEVADELRDHADLVIYDTPPLLPVPDALDMLDGADATLWVVRLDHTKKNAVSLGIERLVDLGFPLAGFVTNDVSPDVLRTQFHQGQYPSVGQSRQGEKPKARHAGRRGHAPVATARATRAPDPT